MNAEEVKAMLPILNAFAERRPIQFRDARPHARCREWITINPDTTEFRLNDDVDPEEWRVADFERGR